MVEVLVEVEEDDVREEVTLVETPALVLQRASYESR